MKQTLQIIRKAQWMTINEEIITIHTFQISIIYIELLFHPLRNVITHIRKYFYFLTMNRIK